MVIFNSNPMFYMDNKRGFLKLRLMDTLEIGSEINKCIKMYLGQN